MRKIYRSSASETNISNSSAKVYSTRAINVPNTLMTPSGDFGVYEQGMHYRVRKFGLLSSKAASPGNLTINIEIGATIIQTLVLALPVSLVSAIYVLDYELTVMTGGPSGVVRCIGHFEYDSGSGAMKKFRLGGGTLSPVAFNANQQLRDSYQFSLADVANILTLDDHVSDKDI